MGMEKVRPVLRWPGGKTRLLSKILPLVPPHRCYCEPFAGGMAVLLAKPRSKVEVVNDLNGDLVAVYRCAQFHLPALIDELKWMTASRQNVKDFAAQPGLTDLQRAARFLIRNRTSFGGGGTSFAVTKTEPIASVQVLTNLLSALRERLDGVAVENVSYERCLALYDSPETVFFMDPPYCGSETNAYSAWTADDMRAFAARVLALQGRWIVTVNDSVLTRQLFADCEIQAVSTRSGCGNQRTHPGRRFAEMIVRPKGIATIGRLKLAA